MIFLQELYNIVEALFGAKINHFYLIELIFFSLDRTLLLFIFWGIFRFIYIKWIKKSWPIKNVRREVILNVFVFYILLLIHLTVFREGTSFVHASIELRPLSVVNWVPFVETMKLTQGITMLTFYYNLYGNILWFVPMGFGAAYLSCKKHSFFRTLSIGFFASLTIEVLQYLFGTGIPDIDDLIFNTVGTIIGIFLFQLVRWILVKIKKNRKKAVLKK